MMLPKEKYFNEKSNKMKEIIKYNKVDVKVLYEIIIYLRKIILVKKDQEK